MRICIIGKYPPIQGGVSMRTFRTAHAFASRGHEVHVVTNAKEVEPPFRMHMRPQDWHRCEARSGSGSVTVHWTDPVDRSQFHIPMSSPFVSKLAGIAAAVHAAHPLDVIFSHYMEPHGVAGHLAAQMTGAPHVVRMAGSDAGRLWHHPQLERLYDHVLRSAEFVVAVGQVAERAAARGVEPARIVSGGGYSLPEDEFAPGGAVLDLNALRDEIGNGDRLRDMVWGDFAGHSPHFGIYGKLGDNKGSFALLDALHRMKLEGLDIGLVALAHGKPEVEQRFRDHASMLGLTDRVLQIPFLPHWRVPEFLRGCLAVCCLEQDFPIRFHNPIVLFEVLLCGTCLVASAETIRKLPGWERLPSGYSCIAINDVNDVGALSSKLAAIVRKARLTGIVGARGRAFAQTCQQDPQFPARLESILQAAAEHRKPRSLADIDQPDTDEPDRFLLTRIARSALPASSAPSQTPRDASCLSDHLDFSQARMVLDRLKKALASGHANLQNFVHGAEVEIAMAEAEIDLDCDVTETPASDPLFRVSGVEWALEQDMLGSLMPIRQLRLRVLHFDYDISSFLGVHSLADFPTSLGAGPSHLVVFGSESSREPALVDEYTARILELSDGSRSGHEIVSQISQEFEGSKADDHLAWLEQMLVSGFIGLQTRAPIEGDRSLLVPTKPES